MNRSNVSAVLLAGILALVCTARAPARPEHEHDDAYHTCAKACAHCMLACESCARHCAHMLEKGEKKHLKTLATCADCGDFCALAAKVTARRGPLSATTCEACAKVCDACAKSCEEFPSDEHMKKCAVACRDCAKACRDMVKHAGAHKEARTAR
jgi:hypothetical protein